MEVNKFGGASIKDAESVKRMVQICKQHISSGVIVVSAMGKTTNLLEQLAHAYYKCESLNTLRETLFLNHLHIINGLFPKEHKVFKKLNSLLIKLDEKLDRTPGLNFDFEYDQIVSFGELISSLIVSEYFNYSGFKVEYVDVRPIIRTDSRFREASINWEFSTPLVQHAFKHASQQVYLTQGFIGSDVNNQSTTLGREGSDYTASAIASMLKCHKVVVWKDVDGFLSADPQWLPEFEILPRVSYHEAIELSYFGAKVIHPKTIKPLQNQGIPLQVRSFLNPDSEGTTIGDDDYYQLPPLYIRKQHQTLISITPFDYGFILEQNLSDIFSIFAKHQVKVNLMQNSAISFSVCVEGASEKMQECIRELKQNYNAKYNANLTLITIRHYITGSEKKVIGDKTILVEQRSRSVARFVIREIID